MLEKAAPFAVAFQHNFTKRAVFLNDTVKRSDYKVGDRDDPHEQYSQQKRGELSALHAESRQSGHQPIVVSAGIVTHLQVDISNDLEHSLEG